MQYDYGDTHIHIYILHIAKRYLHNIEVNTLQEKLLHLRGKKYINKWQVQQTKQQQKSQVTHPSGS